MTTNHSSSLAGGPFNCELHKGAATRYIEQPVPDGITKPEYEAQCSVCYAEERRRVMMLRLRTENERRKI